MKVIFKLICVFGGILVLSASSAIALPKCKGSPTKRWLVTKNWHNCHGVYIFTGWGLTEGHTFSGEFQDGERYGYGEWTFHNHVRKGFFIGTSIVKDRSNFQLFYLASLFVFVRCFRHQTLSRPSAFRDSY